MNPNLCITNKYGSELKGGKWLVPQSPINHSFFASEKGATLTSLKLTHQGLVCWQTKAVSSKNIVMRLSGY